MNRAPDNIPREALGAGRSGEGAAVLEDVRRPDVGLEVAEIEGTRKRLVARDGDVLHVFKYAGQQGRRLVIGADFDEDCDDGDGSICSG